MKEADSILKDIKNKYYKPIYFLSGDEPYFIDLITKALQKNVLTEDEKTFNEHVFYGNEIDMETIVSQAKQYPMMSDHQLVIIKEAQHLSRNIQKLESYAENPLPSTILVFNYKYKTLDKRTKLYKTIGKKGIAVESKKLYDNQLPDWIENQAKKLGFSLEPKSKFLLSEFIGNDLSRINNELDKLNLILPKGTQITPELVEKHIGISKDYNNFELNKAVAAKAEQKAFTIAKNFGQNPKGNPLVVTITVLFNFFSNLMVYHTLSDKSQSHVARALKINPYFVSEYQQAARIYPLKKVTYIISQIRETDVKSKGVGVSGNVTSEQLLVELLYKIFRV